MLNFDSSTVEITNNYTLSYGIWVMCFGLLKAVILRILRIVNIFFYFSDHLKPSLGNFIPSQLINIEQLEEDLESLPKL